MAPRTVPIDSAAAPKTTNGRAMAAFLGAGIGAFAMGATVLLDEAGIFATPALYDPAGGVSGRTTLAAIVWLVAWGLLHHRWNAREIAARRVYPLTFTLIGLGMFATFPPVWGLL